MIEDRFADNCELIVCIALLGHIADVDRCVPAEDACLCYHRATCKLVHRSYIMRHGLVAN